MFKFNGNVNKLLKLKKKIMQDNKVILLPAQLLNKQNNSARTTVRV